MVYPDKAKKIVAFTLFLCLSPPVNYAQESFNAPTPTEVKVAYLVNFARYIRWPASAFADSSAPIIIALEDSHPLAKSLNNITAARTADGRDIVFQTFSSMPDLRQIHILYVGDDSRIFREINKLNIVNPILTVGDAATFIESGGIIRLAEEDDRIIFYVSRDMAENVGLNIHYKVLEMARND